MRLVGFRAFKSPLYYMGVRIEVTIKMTRNLAQEVNLLGSSCLPAPKIFKTQHILPNILLIFIKLKIESLSNIAIKKSLS